MIFFESWYELLRVAVTSVSVYLLCVLLVNCFGKRSSAKMNNFDWIVTVAMGSLLGSAALLKKVVVLEVAVGLFVLLFLQYLFTFLSVRFSFFNSLVKKTPTLLFYDGAYLQDALTKERITKEEVQIGIRLKGYPCESLVAAVIFEPNGELSVLAKDNSDSIEVQSPEDWRTKFKENEA